MRRHSALGLTFLLMSLWWGRTAISQSGFVSLLTGASAVGLGFLGGAIISGVVTPSSIPDTKLGPLATRIFVIFSSIGAVAILLISVYLYAGS
ncbi:hypothetical protein [Haloquadratum walsbyi]|nr:hypothetical protein [Haloquadratum walsbyi]